MTELSAIPGVTAHTLAAFADERGSFREIFRASWLPDAPRFVQGNASVSRPGVLRGLHYHLEQDDYWVVLRGRVTAALADLRGLRRPSGPDADPGSHTSGPDAGPGTRRAPVQTATLELGEGRALFIPHGVAHGFYAHDDVLLVYQVSRYYDDGRDEHGVAWDDPDLAISWPCQVPILSRRDRDNPRLRDIPPHRLPAGGTPASGTASV